MTKDVPGVQPIKNARVLAVFGDSITTDHISPAGDIKKDGPAGKFLEAHGVAKADFNSFGSRRGNHEIMMRGTFAKDRKSVVWGKGVSVRVDPGGRRYM